MYLFDNEVDSDEKEKIVATLHVTPRRDPHSIST